MRNLLHIILYAITTLARLLRPGGARALAAENLALKQQLIVVNRSRQRAPNLTTSDRVIFAICALFIRPNRIDKIAVVVRPSTILRFHRSLVQRKYSALFTPKVRAKPGPKGPTQDIIDLIVELKRRNSTFGCPRIALIVNSTLDVDIDRNVVRRILIKHYKPRYSGTDGPSWLTFFADAKDSVWSLDLFRCESIHLKTHRVLVIIDIFSRRIIGVDVRSGSVDGPAVRALFARSTRGKTPPLILTTDNDPLFRFHRWHANLRILGVEEIKSIPFVPQSHPFVERLIGTIRREYLDQTLFWTSLDLERKLANFTEYYDQYRVHQSLDGKTPGDMAENKQTSTNVVSSITWESHLNGRCELPMEA